MTAGIEQELYNMISFIPVSHGVEKFRGMDHAASFLFSLNCIHLNFLQPMENSNSQSKTVIHICFAFQLIEKHSPNSKYMF
jgi:hypothetical protein